MKRELYYVLGDEVCSVNVEANASGWQVTVDGRIMQVNATSGERGRLALEIDGRRVLAHVAHDGPACWVHVDGATVALERVRGPRPHQAEAGTQKGPLRAAMPGRVLDVLVQEGATVTKGQTLVLLEAMKMELRIAAPADGVTEKVYVEAGQVVERGAPLVEIVG